MNARALAILEEADMFDPETEVTETQFYRIAEQESLRELAEIIDDETSTEGHDGVEIE